MASENTVFYEKLAEAVRNYPPCLYDKSRLRRFPDYKLKNPFVLVLLSEHSQVSEIIEIGGKKVSGICRAAKAAG